MHNKNEFNEDRGKIHLKWLGQGAALINADEKKNVFFCILILGKLACSQ